jgi:O-antigen biosynthesis protein
VFTPSHDGRFLQEAYASLQAQSDPDWQWVLLHNNGGQRIEFDDPRVTQQVCDDAPALVGALKAMACELADGEALLELDHDDLLAPTAIAETKAALSRSGFCYSNTAPFGADFAKGERYSERYGWRYRATTFAGHELDEHVAFAPNADAVSRIWFAPNHLRAFTRAAYDQVGGYARTMRVLDDQDLMSRLYQVTAFTHIDQPLYLQRVHERNTQLVHNKEIQDNVWRLYDKHVAQLAQAWAKRAGLRVLDVGGRLNSAAGYETVDLRDADVCCDLNQRWPFEDSSVGVIRAFDVFEHLRDPLHTMQEVYRVLAPGGWLFAQVPSTDGRGAFQDPTHVSFWNENSWAYYSNANFAKYIGTPVRFQAPRVYTTAKDAREVCWTVAHLISLKDGYRPPGLLDI